MDGAWNFVLLQKLFCLSEHQLYILKNRIWIVGEGYASNLICNWLGGLDKQGVNFLSYAQNWKRE